jgi:hypothetical protein
MGAYWLVFEVAAKSQHPTFGTEGGEVCTKSPPLKISQALVGSVAICDSPREMVSHAFPASCSKKLCRVQMGAYWLVFEVAAKLQRPTFGTEGGEVCTKSPPFATSQAVVESGNTRSASQEQSRI